MKTAVNGRQATWTKDLADLFWKHVGGRMKPGERITWANRFTPRPYRDEWNRGSPYEGFVYVVDRGCERDVAFVKWIPGEQ
jgi:hypothetical protein